MLDMKSAIYGPLSETYPWVHRVLLHEGGSSRQPWMWLRNARHFESVYVSWDANVRRMLASLIDHQLAYLLAYWGL